MSSAQALAMEANALAGQGKDGAAAALYARALREYPAEPRLANSAGNFHFRSGRHAEALELFLRALTLDPGLLEAGRNAAIACLRLNRPARAVDLLRPFESKAAGDAAYWSLRADAERAATLYREAQASIARAQALAPGDRNVARSRARLALERNDPAVLTAHEQALALNPGDPHLLLDHAQALALHGRLPEALANTAALVDKVPQWIEALRTHAELRWAAGERDGFDDHFPIAAGKMGSPVAIHLAWAAVLEGVDRHAESAAMLGEARRRWPEDRDLALAQAIALGEAGRARDARSVLDGFAAATGADWDLARARIDLRLGDIARAEATLGRMLLSDRTSVDAWALIDLAWRLTEDPRHQFLHGRDGLVRQLALPLDGDEVAAIVAALEEMHRHTAMPIGQSVKSGSQTKGALFARLEPELAVLEQALVAVLEEYRAGLPPLDADHPLLARREDPWAITGSWSIRLNGQGHHAAHIHPRGILSSASYWRVPDEVDAPGQPGWLEIGRPPPGLAEGLGALHAIRPQQGHCVLFPSTLFHGTRPIASGTRMTVAFDVTAADAA